MHLAREELSLLFLVLFASCYERKPIRANQETGRPVEVPLLVAQSLHADLFAFRRRPFWVLVRERGRIVGGRGRAPGDRCRHNAYRDPNLSGSHHFGTAFFGLSSFGEAIEAHCPHKMLKNLRAVTHRKIWWSQSE
jgi:hypothetical protein